MVKPTYKSSKTKALIKVLATNLKTREDVDAAFEQAKQLIDAGADPKAVTKNGDTFMVLFLNHLRFHETNRDEAFKQVQAMLQELDYTWGLQDSKLFSKNSSYPMNIEVLVRCGLKPYHVEKNKEGNEVKKPCSLFGFLLDNELTNMFNMEENGPIMEGIKKRAEDNAGINEESEIADFEAFFETVKFTQDAVLLAHKTGVEKDERIQYNGYDFEQKLSGSDVSITLPSCLESWQDFLKSDMGRNPIPDCPKENLKALTSLITETFETAKKPHTTKHMTNPWNETAERYLEGKPVLLESNWKEHSAMTILYKDMIYICNKGRGAGTPSIKAFKINDLTPLIPQPDIEKTMLVNIVATQLKEISTYERNVRFGIAGDTFQSLSGSKAKFELAPPLQGLALEQVGIKHLIGQKISNCTYTNTKRAIDGLMIALADRQKLDDQQETFPDSWPQPWLTPQTESLGVDVSTLDTDDNPLYSAFTVYDRKREVENYCRKHLPGGASLDDKQTELHVLLLVLQHQFDVKSARNIEQGKAICQHLMENHGMKMNDIIEKVESLGKETKRYRVTNYYAARAQQKWLKKSDQLTPEKKEVTSEKKSKAFSTELRIAKRREFLAVIEKELKQPDISSRKSPQAPSA